MKKSFLTYSTTCVLQIWYYSVSGWQYSLPYSSLVVLHSFRLKNRSYFRLYKSPSLGAIQTSIAFVCRITPVCLFYIQIINSNFHPLKLTGTRKGQSSVLHSFVTQWRKTVDIFWFLCFTKRNTSNENRPIWLLPFSIIVVCGSLSQLVFVEKIKTRMSSCMISILKLLAKNKIT